jgi:group II intron reverse transcriptase/maturase
MRLITLPKVEKLQQALHAKAKQSPNFRFYTLYDKIYREDVLWVAYRRSLANGGVPGVDGQTFDDIEAYGAMRWLSELAEELKTKTYRPSPVRRANIAKADGGQRPLGIPTIKDRVVQMAALLILEPIFEADLQPEQHAYRQGHSALDAVNQVQRLVRSGYREVVDADLSGYFDSIPHAELMRSVARRVCDKHVLHLVKMWLVAPVEETGERGRTRRTTRNKDTKRGTPQGAPISPLLANVYMRRFVLGWKTLGYERRLRARIVNYADDFVICCRGTADQAMAAMRSMMERLKLTVNEKKTHVCRLPDESFDFLSYTFSRLYSPRTGHAYLGTMPARKSISDVCRKLTALTDRDTLPRDIDEQVGRLNRLLSGWGRYFSQGTLSKAYRIVNDHARERLRQWLCAKHKHRSGGYTRFSNLHLVHKLGLVQLGGRRGAFACAKA